MPEKMKVPLAVVAGLMLAIALDTAIQVLWKLSVAGVAADASAYAAASAALSNRYFYLAMVCFVGQLFNWLRVLARADLSFAQPFTALSYITVLTISSHSLHERISLTRMGGVALILLGVYFISRTSHCTLPLGEKGDAYAPGEA